MGNRISGDYVAGFTDGEGCFALKLRRDAKRDKEYFYWTAEFAIVLRSDDADLLYAIQNVFGCGKVTFTKKNDQARFSVQGTAELNNVVVPFFRKHVLHGKKRHD